MSNIDIHIFISETILKFGINPNVKGYTYLKSAILIVFNEIDLLQQMTVVYKLISKEYKTKHQNVERAIRYAINQAWNCNRLNYDLIPCSTKPCNSELIALLVDFVRNHINLSSKLLSSYHNSDNKSSTYTKVKDKNLTI